MLQDYKIHCEERKEQGIPPLPLSAQQTSELVELLKSEHQESELLLELLKERTPAGVDQSAYVKQDFWQTSQLARQAALTSQKKKL